MSVAGMRIGQGFDTHRFGSGDHVMLGGVRIAHTRGVVAHSDGDVVLHALADALLGAIAAGDIGHFFPDDDVRWAGADSGELLTRVVDTVTRAGWVTLNADCTVLAETPRIAPHIATMRKRIADLLAIDVDAVSIKATTAEGMGFIGRGEGIAASAVVLLTSR